MKKFYNLIFPVWLFFILPTTLLFSLGINFIIDSAILFLLLLLLKVEHPKNIYCKTIWKVWLFGFVADMIGTLLLLLTQFLGFSTFIYNHFTYPISWNPFLDIYAVVYCTIAVIISAIFIYHLNAKYTFKKTTLDKRKTKIIALILAFFTAPYMFYLPTAWLFHRNDDYNNIPILEQNRGSYVGDNTAVGIILDHISSAPYRDHFELVIDKKPYKIIIYYKEKEIGNVYQMMEEDAAMLFNLISNVDIVEYHYQNKVYDFEFKKLNAMFDQKLRKIDLEKIQEYYHTKAFENYTYLGSIDSTYQVFLKESICLKDPEILYETEDYTYLVSCTTKDNLILVNKKGETTLLIDALKEKKITIKDLNQTIIELQVQKRSTETTLLNP